MGAHPFWYFFPYDPDIQSALNALRNREFEAGRYNPVVSYIEFPVDPSKVGPGRQHRSIEHARESANEDGTRSILDIEEISDSPEYGAAVELHTSYLEELFDTTQPTHDMVESELRIFDRIERGQAVYVIVFKDEKPTELFFAGYSFD